MQIINLFRKNQLTLGGLILAALAFARPILAQRPSTWLESGFPNALQFGNYFAANTNGVPQDIRTIVANIIMVVLGILGTIFIIMIIVGGFKWMTSQGNAVKTAAARQVLTTAIIGLLIILASFAITIFVVRATIGTTTGQTKDELNAGRVPQNTGLPTQ